MSALLGPESGWLWCIDGRSTKPWQVMKTLSVARRVWVIYWIFIAAIILLLVVLLQIEQFGSVDELTHPVALIIPAATVWGFVSWLLVRRKMRLDGSSKESVGSEYLKAFLLRLAFAEASISLGIALAIYRHAFILYLYAIILGALPMALAAPPDRKIDQLQEHLTARGSSVDLRAAITAPRGK
jgi:hypothetical protein